MAEDGTRRFRLEMCRCGRHGRIVEIDGGYKGPEFCSKPEALFALKVALGFDDLVRKTNEQLKREIEAAKYLPEIDAWVDREVRAQVALWNTARALGNVLDPVQFHGYYFKGW